MILPYLLSTLGALKWSNCMALYQLCFSSLVILRNAKTGGSYK